jgi:hypothetical protein
MDEARRDLLTIFIKEISHLSVFEALLEYHRLLPVR